MDTEKVIREYLPNVIHMSLATCANNKPWVCEVHYVFDDELNIYWRSKSSRRHSQEITANPNVAGNIVSQHQAGEKPRGVYFEGTASLLTDVDENHPAYKLYCDRFGTGLEILEEAKQENGHKFYMAKVSDYYVFDVRESPGVKYHLEWGNKS